MDFLKITKAWITSFNPNDRELTIANARYDICDKCPSKVKSTLSYYKCNECGCPIQKKIFSAGFNDCPLGKWEEVDTKNFLPRKKDKTLF